MQIDLQYKMKTLSFDKETVLFRQDETHAFVYQIQQGFIISYGNSIDGKKGLTDLYGQGNWIGPGLNDGVATQNANVKPDSVLQQFTQADFDLAINKDINLAKSLIKQLSLREQTLQQRLFLQQTASLVVRLAHLLLYLFANQSESCTHGHEQHVKLSQQELADMIGGSRQSISQILSEWKHSSLIDYTRSYICLENIAELKKLYSE